MRSTKKYTILLAATTAVVMFFIIRNNPQWYTPRLFETTTVGYLKPDKTDSLRLKIYLPVAQKNPNKTAIVMFHGGGWKNGHIGQFYRHAEEFSKEGIVVFLAEYRTQQTHNTSPFDALKDARSAMRFVKKHATEYQVDPDRIAVLGSSVGGHMALGTALLNTYNHPTDDLAIDTTPVAIITLSGIINTGPKGFGTSETKAQYETFSPFHNIKPNMPSLLMLSGDKDRHFTPEELKEFASKWEAAGNSCELVIAPGKEHGYTGVNRSPEDFAKMIAKSLSFLRELGLH